MTEGDTGFPGSVVLQDRLLEAIDYAIGIVSKYNEPLLPFVWTDTEVYGFMGDTLEEAVSMARCSLPTIKGTKYRLLAYDGFLTIGDDRNDAIYIEAQDTGANFALRVAQRYSPAGKGKKLEVIGNPVLLGKIDSFDS